MRLILCAFLVLWWGTMCAQDIRFNDSIPLRYGMKYALNNLPVELVKEAGISEDSLRVVYQKMSEFVSENDSIRIFAPKTDMHFISKDFSFYEQPFKGVPFVTSFHLGNYEEDGVLLFNLRIRIDMIPNSEKTYICKKLTMIVNNYDPSFLNINIKNVRFELSPIRQIASPFDRKRGKNFYQYADSLFSDKNSFFRYDFKIEGDIYAERLLSAGSIKAGLLYKFYGTYKDGKARRKIVPIEF